MSGEGGIRGAGLGDWHLPPVEPASAVLTGSRPPALAVPPAPASVATPAPAELPAPLAVSRRNPAHAEPVSPMRALAGALIAVAGVLLGIGALLWATDAPGGDPTLTALNGPQTHASAPAAQAPAAQPFPATPGSAAAAPAATAVPVAPAKPAAAPVPRLALTVLNNSTRPLLAERAATRFRAGGWPVTRTGNFTGRVSDTTVYYAPGQLASAQLLQRSFPGLTRVRPRFPRLPGSGLTVVLTRAYAA